MTPKNLRRIIIGTVLFWVLFTVVMYQAFAATWIEQQGIYNLYKYGSANKYELSSKTVPNTWIRQSGTYTQLKSAAGATKYELIDVQSVNCNAFMCKSDFGIDFDLTKNTVLACPRVHITKEQLALIYDGVKAEGLPACK